MNFNLKKYLNSSTDCNTEAYWNGFWGVAETGRQITVHGQFPTHAVNYIYLSKPANCPPTELIGPHRKKKRPPQL